MLINGFMGTERNITKEPSLCYRVFGIKWQLLGNKWQFCCLGREFLRPGQATNFS